MSLTYSFCNLLLSFFDRQTQDYLSKVLMFWNSYSPATELFPNCKINFNYLRPGESSGLADIQVVPDGGTLSPVAAATIEFPTATGNPGWRIMVNTDVYTPAPGNSTPEADRPSYMRFVMAHALGLTMGFRRPGDPAGIQIPGTPGSDAASVINGTGSPNSGHFLFTESHFNSFFPATKQSGVQIRIINDTKE